MSAALAYRAVNVLITDAETADALLVRRVLGGRIGTRGV